MLENYNKRKDNLIKYLEIIAEKTKNLSNSYEVFIIDQEY